MSEDWRDKLSKLRDHLLRDADAKSIHSRTTEDSKPHVPARPTSSGGAAPPTDAIRTPSPVIGTVQRQGMNGGRIPAIDAILGIDFGTRFTKIALSLPHIDRREILAFGTGKIRLLPSRVIIGDDRVFAVGPAAKSASRQIVEYLKVRLADPNAEAFGTSMSVGPVPLPQAIRAICAHYLATVLRLAVNAAQTTLPNELSSGRPVNWFANVGVPVKHCDSEVLAIFREVTRVAWQWHHRELTTPSVTDLIRDYTRTLTAIAENELPINTAPELAAALVHFAEHRNTPEGLYAFFDIGGGTVDGSVFRLSRHPDGVRFDILSANVDEIGSMAIARRLVAQAYLQMSELVEKPLIFGGATPSPALSIPGELEERVQAFFTSVIGDAKKKLPGHIFGNLSDVIQTRPGLNQPSKPIVPVFVAGGGCGSEWYRQLLRKTHSDHNHASLGVGGYKIDTVPTPTGIVDEQYPRFVVALGLTSESLHFDKYRLPSRFKNAGSLPSRTTSAPSYLDTKDLV